MILSTLLILQAAPTSSNSPAGGGGGGGGAPASCAGGDLSFLFTMAIFFLVMYFLMIRPQQKRQKEHQKLLESLKKGDIVRTDSGIRGEIVSIDEREVQLLIAEKTKINILRTRIAGLDVPPADKDGKGGAAAAR